MDENIPCPGPGAEKAALQSAEPPGDEPALICEPSPHAMWIQEAVSGPRVDVAQLIRLGLGPV